MKKLSLSSVVFILLLAGALFLPGPGYAAPFWSFLQGTNCVVEYPENTFNNDYKGWGLDFYEVANTSNWVHCSVPSVLSRVSGRIYFQLYHVGGGSIATIHLYNGHTRTHVLTAPALVAGWNTINITLPADYFFSVGLGISVNVVANATANTRFVFGTAGAYFN